MTKSIELKSVSIDRLMEYFGSRAKEMEHTSPTYVKAVAAFKAYINMSGATAITEPLLADWFVNMYLRDFTFKTSLHYFNIISGLYTAAVKERIAQPCDAFRTTKAKIARLGETGDSVIDKTGFERFKNLMRNAVNQNAEIAQATDLLLLTLLNGCRSLIETALLKRNDIEPDDREKQAIADRHAYARRQYIFDLKQSLLTPRQLSAAIDTEINTLFIRKNIPHLENADETATAYWAYAALQCGLSGSTVVSYLGKVPKGIPALGLCEKTELTEEKCRRTTKLVGDIFIENPLRWYALRLRTRGGFSQFIERLDDLRNQPGVFVPEIFYPLEEVAKRIRKKLVFETQPVLPDIIFINCRVTSVLPFLLRVNDLAWCYTVTGRPGSDYAVIPDSSFRKFQEAIGHFATCYAEDNPSIKAQAGDKVRVNVGLFQGLETTIDSIANEDGNKILRLLYHSDNGIRWNVGVPARTTGILTRTEDTGVQASS